MAKVELTPLRSWDDFLPGSERFARPDVTDVARWNKRVVSNLLYYQTNYLLLAAAVLLLAGLLNPAGMLTAVGVMAAVVLGAVWAGDNAAALANFRRQNPAAFVLVVVATSYLLLSLLGSVMVFMSAVTLPLTLVLLHASCRLRNMKNKLENKMEGAGLKRSPMGLLLEVLGQQEENLQKVQSLLEKKLKD